MTANCSSHPEWSRVADRVVFAARADQTYIHGGMICAIKRNADAGRFVGPVQRLLGRYGARTAITECSEPHLLAKQMTGEPSHGGASLTVVDPLGRIARRW